MEITQSAVTGRSVCLALAGELDMVHADRLDDAVRVALDTGVTDVVVDLHGVTFCDSAGVTALIRARAHAAERGARLCVVDAQRRVLRTLQITGVLELLTVA